MIDLKEFQAAMASGDNQPYALFEALGAVTDATIGVKLFTLITFDENTNKARRIHSNMSDAYPVKGTKDVEDNRWTRHVLREHKTFVANTIDEIACVFPDHELIQSLGCESCINIPVIVRGSVIGTLNCLHDCGHYTPERVINSDILKLPGAVAFLAASHMQTGA